jgi:hypothetical protein
MPVVRGATRSKGSLPMLASCALVARLLVNSGVGGGDVLPERRKIGDGLAAGRAGEERRRAATNMRSASTTSTAPPSAAAIA